jgi:uncharacterized membrane protein YagU involved in acid resistance
MPDQRCSIGGNGAGPLDKSGAEIKINAIVRFLTILLGGIAAVMAWLGWLAVAPALGLPDLATAAMVNRDVASDENPGFWLGWVILLAALAAAIVVYLFATERFVRPRAALGILYGLALWFVAGAVVMPLLAWGAPAAAPAPPLPPGVPPPPQAPDPMHASFMMLDYSNWAPVSAAVAWLLFGAILGATSVWRAREEP